MTDTVQARIPELAPRLEAAAQEYQAQVMLAIQHAELEIWPAGSYIRCTESSCYSGARPKSWHAG